MKIIILISTLISLAIFTFSIYAFDDGPMPPGVTINVKVYLEGFYIAQTGKMSTLLNSKPGFPTCSLDSDAFGLKFGVKPGMQLKWKGRIPSETYSINLQDYKVTDWILVCLIDSADTEHRYSRAGFLNEDGKIIDVNGNSLDIVIMPGKYYVAIYNTKHLPIMSKYAQELSYGSTLSYDFTKAQNRAFGKDPQVELAPNFWGQYTGDCWMDGVVDIGDWANTMNNWNSTGYKLPDINCDGQVNSADTDFIWFINLFKVTYVPI